MCRQWHLSQRAWNAVCSSSNAALHLHMYYSIVYRRDLRRRMLLCCTSQPRDPPEFPPRQWTVLALSPLPRPGRTESCTGYTPISTTTLCATTITLKCRPVCGKQRRLQSLCRREARLRRSWARCRELVTTLAGAGTLSRVLL